MASISIIIPAHNEENYIAKTIMSIQQQNVKNCEIIIVANGCTDATEEIVRKIRDEDKQVRLFSLPKANVSLARNYGAGKANGEMLLFLDADTILSENSLQKMQAQFTEEHAAATTKVKPDIKELKYDFAMVFKSFYVATGLYKGCSGALLCRRKHFDAVNGYDSNITVKEHRKLMKKLLAYGKYACIDTYVTTSMRRLKQWGLIKATVFWAQQWIIDKIGKLEKSEYQKVR